MANVTQSVLELVFSLKPDQAGAGAVIGDLRTVVKELSKLAQGSDATAARAQRLLKAFDLTKVVQGGERQFIHFSQAGKHLQGVLQGAVGEINKFATGLKATGATDLGKLEGALASLSQSVNQVGQVKPAQFVDGWRSLFSSIGFNAKTAAKDVEAIWIGVISRILAESGAINTIGGKTREAIAGASVAQRDFVTGVSTAVQGINSELHGKNQLVEAINKGLAAQELATRVVAQKVDLEGKSAAEIAKANQTYQDNIKSLSQVVTELREANRSAKDLSQNLHQPAVAVQTLRELLSRLPALLKEIKTQASSVSDAHKASRKSVSAQSKEADILTRKYEGYAQQLATISKRVTDISRTLTAGTGQRFFGLGTAGLKSVFSELEGVNQSAKQVASTLGTLATTASPSNAALAKQLRDLQADYRRMGDTASESLKRVGEQLRDVSTLTRALEQRAGVATTFKEMTNEGALLGKSLTTLVARYSSLFKVTSEAAVRVAAAGRALEESMVRFRSGVQLWAMGVQQLGQTMLQPIKDSVTIFAQFTDTMAMVRAVTNATAAEFARLTNAAEIMGATTRFTAEESADALRFLGLAGFSAADAVTALPVALNIAQAAMIDLGRATDVITNIMTSFQLEAEDLTFAADVMTKAFTTSNSTLDQLGFAFRYVGAIAKGFGSDIHDTVGALALLHNAGFKACYDDQTEVQTLEGFKLFKDLVGSDFILTLNPETEKAEWQKPTGIFEYDVREFLFTLQTDTVDVAVTDNHTLWFRDAGVLRSVKASEFQQGAFLTLDTLSGSRPEQPVTLHDPETYVKFEWKSYQGKVYCAEVPNHVMYVRRNGKSYFCGNSLAGTALRGAFQRLFNPTKENARLLRDIGTRLGTTGLQLQDASGNFIGFVSLIRQLERAGVDSAEILELFGQRAGPGLASLMRIGSDALEEYVTTLEHAEGTTARISEIMQVTLTGTALRAKSALQSLAVQVGENLEPALIGSLSAFESVALRLNTLREEFHVFFAIFDNVAAGFIAIAAAVGVLTAAYYLMIVPTAQFIAGMKTFIAIKAVIIQQLTIEAGKTGILATSQVAQAKAQAASVAADQAKITTTQGLLLITKGYFLSLGALIAQTWRANIANVTFTASTLGLAGAMGTLLAVVKTLWTVLLANPIFTIVTAVAALLLIAHRPWEVIEAESTRSGEAVRAVGQSIVALGDSSVKQLKRIEDAHRDLQRISDSTAGFTIDRAGDLDRVAADLSILELTTKAAGKSAEELERIPNAVLRAEKEIGIAAARLRQNAIKLLGEFQRLQNLGLDLSVTVKYDDITSELQALRVTYNETGETVELLPRVFDGLTYSLQRQVATTRDAQQEMQKLQSFASRLAQNLEQVFQERALQAQVIRLRDLRNQVTRNAGALQAYTVTIKGLTYERGRNNRSEADNADQIAKSIAIQQLYKQTLVTIARTYGLVGKNADDMRTRLLELAESARSARGRADFLAIANDAEIMAVAVRDAFISMTQVSDLDLDASRKKLLGEMEGIKDTAHEFSEEMRKEFERAQKSINTVFKGDRKFAEIFVNVNADQMKRQLQEVDRATARSLDSTERDMNAGLARFRSSVRATQQQVSTLLANSIRNTVRFLVSDVRAVATAEEEKIAIVRQSADDRLWILENQADKEKRLRQTAGLEIQSVNKRIAEQAKKLANEEVQVVTTALGKMESKRRDLYNRLITIENQYLSITEGIEKARQTARDKFREAESNALIEVFQLQRKLDTARLAFTRGATDEARAILTKSVQEINTIIDRANKETSAGRVVLSFATGLTSQMDQMQRQFKAAETGQLQGELSALGGRIKSVEKTLQDLYDEIDTLDTKLKQINLDQLITEGHRTILGEYTDEMGELALNTAKMSEALKKLTKQQAGLNEEFREAKQAEIPFDLAVAFSRIVGTVSKQAADAATDLGQNTEEGIKSLDRQRRFYASLREEVIAFDKALNQAADAGVKLPFDPKDLSLIEAMSQALADPALADLNRQLADLPEAEVQRMSVAIIDSFNNIALGFYKAGKRVDEVQDQMSKLADEFRQQADAYHVDVTTNADSALSKVTELLRGLTSADWTTQFKIENLDSEIRKIDQAIKKFEQLRKLVESIEFSDALGGPQGSVVQVPVPGGKTGGFPMQFAGGGSPLYTPSDHGPRVPGTGAGDKILSLLDPREYVIPPKRVKQLGIRFLEDLRFDRLPKFAAGGIAAPELAEFARRTFGTHTDAALSRLSSVTSQLASTQSAHDVVELKLDLGQGMPPLTALSPRDEVNKLVRAIRSRQ